MQIMMTKIRWNYCAYITQSCFLAHSCPFDIVSIYDGFNESSPLIGQYCGQQRNLVVYSTANYLYVTFDTLQRAANTQNRGFKGMFEFSESFVKLGESSWLNFYETSFLVSVFRVFHSYLKCIQTKQRHYFSYLIRSIIFRFY